MSILLKSATSIKNFSENYFFEDTSRSHILVIIKQAVEQQRSLSFCFSKNHSATQILDR